MTITSSLGKARHRYSVDLWISRSVRFSALLLFAFFFTFSIDALNIPIERMLGMFGPLSTMITERLMPPDMTYATSPLVLYSLVETIEMSLLGALIGTIISLPLAWLGAWNVTPSRTFLYPLARTMIVVARAVPTLMWAIILVTIFGFGPFAGTLALVKSTIGFAGKLMAEQVEAIDMDLVEAIRATGASELHVFFFAVLPQVWAAWLGIWIYNWDSQFRGSTILGFVGAGGIGLYLRERISILEYHGALGIIMIIIALVIISEVVSDRLRHRFY